MYSFHIMQNLVQDASVGAQQSKYGLWERSSRQPRYQLNAMQLNALQLNALQSVDALFGNRGLAISDNAPQALLDGRTVYFVTETGQDEVIVDEPVRILVMDDSPVIRHLIVAMLEDIGGVDEVVQVADAPAAVQAVANEAPQIAILDIKVPGDARLRNGIDVLREIKRTAPATEVIMLTNHAIPLYRHTCMEAGASYFLDKSSEFDQLPEAIERILQGTN